MIRNDQGKLKKKNQAKEKSAQNEVKKKGVARSENFPFPKKKKTNFDFYELEKSAEAPDLSYLSRMKAQVRTQIPFFC